MLFRYFRIAIIFTAASAAGLLYFFYSPYQDPHFPGCALHSLTGLYCPACGSQRAFSDLLHGHFIDACRNNLLFIFTLGLLLAWYITEVRNVIGNRPASTRRWPKSTPWIVLSVVMGFFLLRNLPFTPFHLLAPAG